MNDIELSQPNPEDFDEFITVPTESYGSDATDGLIAHERLSNEIDRSWGVRDTSRWVAGSGAFSMAVTLPGGAELPVAGVTMIGVAPTHRRRGILTAMLRQLHDDADTRNEPLALLTASETSIYRRFGYGIASHVAHIEIAADAVRFNPPLDDTGSIELADPRTDRATLVEADERLRGVRTGWLRLTPGQWATLFADPDFLRDGRSGRRAAIHRDAAGRPDGYVTWRIAASSRSDRLADNTMWIERLVGLDAEIEASLWRFVADIDLVTTVVWQTAPLDPVIRWRLVEPRRLRTLAATDMVWARILDVPRVLSARAYEAPGTLTLEVADHFCPDSGGRFTLSVPQAGATGLCERTEGTHEPDLVLDIADLSSATLGAVAPSRLADAGRLIGSREALTTAERMFRVTELPWSPIEF